MLEERGLGNPSMEHKDLIAMFESLEIHCYLSKTQLYAYLVHLNAIREACSQRTKF